MTKQKRAISISGELDVAIGLLATRRGMNYSEFVETRLREIPELAGEIKRLRVAENPPPMLRGDIKEYLKRSPRDLKGKKSRKLVA